MNHEDSHADVADGDGLGCGDRNGWYDGDGSSMMPSVGDGWGHGGGGTMDGDGTGDGNGYGDESDGWGCGTIHGDTNGDGIGEQLVEND